MNVRYVRVPRYPRYPYLSDVAGRDAAEALPLSKDVRCADCAALLVHQQEQQPTRAYRAVLVASSPLTGQIFNRNYSTVAFESDTPRIEAPDLGGTCDRSTGTGCTIIPPMRHCCRCGRRFAPKGWPQWSLPARPPCWASASGRVWRVGTRIARFRQPLDTRAAVPRFP